MSDQVSDLIDHKQGASEGSARGLRWPAGLAALALTTGALLGCAEPESSTASVASAASVAAEAGTEVAAGADAAVAAAGEAAGGDFASAWGPATGSTIPMLAAADHTGQPQTLESLAGDRGLLLVFSRSADW